jgi:hypothetical protein
MTRWRKTCNFGFDDGSFVTSNNGLENVYPNIRPSVSNIESAEVKTYCERFLRNFLWTHSPCTHHTSVGLVWASARCARIVCCLWPTAQACPTRLASFHRCSNATRSSTVRHALLRVAQNRKIRVRTWYFPCSKSVITSNDWQLSDHNKLHH